MLQLVRSVRCCCCVCVLTEVEFRAAAECRRVDDCDRVAAVAVVPSAHRAHLQARHRCGRQAQRTGRGRHGGRARRHAGTVGDSRGNGVRAGALGVDATTRLRRGSSTRRPTTTDGNTRPHGDVSEHCHADAKQRRSPSAQSGKDRELSALLPCGILRCWEDLRCLQTIDNLMYAISQTHRPSMLGMSIQLNLPGRSQCLATEPCPVPPSRCSPRCPPQEGTDVIRERIELPTFRVLGGRDNQIHHRTRKDEDDERSTEYCRIKQIGADETR
jgi:hypothetical protein